MSYTRLMNKDETGRAPENKVTGEIVQVTKGTAQQLAHSIFFEDGFYIYENPADKTNTLLRRGIDFDFEDEDTITTEITNKNCWRQIVIYKDITKAYIDYQVFGDVVTAELINNVKAQSVDVADKIAAFTGALEADKQDLANHKADTAPHGASSAALPSSLALRTSAGTLQAANATEGSDLVNLSVLNEKQQEQDKATQTKINESSQTIYKLLQANEAVLTKDDFSDGLDPSAPDYEEQLTARLEAHVNDLKPHRNAIRNKDGNLTTGEATLETEAVNKKQLDKAFRDLVGTAPETLDTIYEIAEALHGNANIVNTITDTITAGDATTLTSAKSYTDTKVTDALNTAEDDATTKANAAKQGAVTEAGNYTDGKLTNYYTKTEVDESQEAQDKRIKALEARPTATGTVYDFSRTEASKTGDKIKLSDGTVKDVWRLCVERTGVQNIFTIDISTIGKISKIVRLNGTLTQANGLSENAEGLIQTMINATVQTLEVNIKNKNILYDVLLFFDILL